MPRIRDPNRDKAFEVYKQHKGKIDLVEIANQLNMPPGTIRGWKSKDKWEEQLNGTLPKKTERSANRKASNNKKQIEQEVYNLDNSELTDKQKLFCIYYVKYFNASKAALKAGYSQSYSVSDVYNLLDNPRVKEEINRLKRSKLGRAILSEDDIFQKMIDIAFADITDYVEFGKKEVMIGKDEAGEPEFVKVNYVDLKEATEVDGSLISEVSYGKNGVSVKLQNKMKALEWLADRMDLLTTETQQKLEFEQQKIAIEKAKVETLEDDEIEDDGFMDALKGKVEDIWQE